MTTLTQARRQIRDREHWVSVRPEGLKRAERWIEEQFAFWSLSADALTPGREETEMTTEGAPAPAVEVQRVLSALPEAVYDEWLGAVGMAEWMCPRPARPTRIDLDPRIGGRYVIDINDEGFELPITGEYLELDRPRRLRFTWACSVWEPTGLESIVTVTFEPHGDGRTVMTIHHAQLPPKVSDDHRQGWTLIGDQLEVRLTARTTR